MAHGTSLNSVPDLVHRMSGSNRPKEWTWAPNEAPWFDQPNSIELLERRQNEERLSGADVGLLRHWVANGYCIVSGAVPEPTIDAMERDLDDLWTCERPCSELELLGVRLVAGTEPVNVTHAQLLALGAPLRQQVKQRSNWRIHGFHRFSANAAAILTNPELTRLATLILGRAAVPSYTINFTHGSEQELHQDTAVFHIVPPNFLVGTWLACEDIQPQSGALVVYPGSHRSAMHSEFDDYPQTNLRTSSDQSGYADYVKRLSARYDPMQFLAKKGDILLWHGMLIHGGSPVLNRGLSRRSYVCHYIPPGMDVSAQVHGPFNW
jgi:phytanoyl-CoA hydroxylase